MKKKKLTRKERKQQRREDLARRQQKSSQEKVSSEVLKDAAPILFQMVDDDSGLPSLEQFAHSLAASAELADEPEFEDFLFNPIECLNILEDMLRKLDLDPITFAQLPIDEREEIRIDIQDEIARQLLTDELHQEIIARLDKLRLRLRRSPRRRAETAKAAAIQVFLSGYDKHKQPWRILGLIQALVSRSMVAGFELFEFSEEAVERAASGQGLSQIRQQVNQEKKWKQAERLMQRIPGLQKFVTEEVDRAWETGVKDISTGELYLELFELEELQTAHEIIVTELGFEIDEKAGTVKASKQSKEDIQAMIKALDVYITERFTFERLTQLRERLKIILESSAYTGERLAFVMLLVEYMDAENAVEAEKAFLIKALIGETMIVVGTTQNIED